jgi:RNA polymerase sigma-70 factor, ECF subfamily
LEARTLALDSFERTALAELGLLYRVARRLVLDSVDAEDLVGQTLCAAARAWSSFDGRHPRSWLLTILKNEHLKGIRRAGSRPRTVPMEDNFEHGDLGFGDEVENRALADRILTELDALPEEFRMAVALCDVEQMSYEEAAKVMRVPVGTVRSRLFRGRRALRERLKAI